MGWYLLTYHYKYETLIVLEGGTASSFSPSCEVRLYATGTFLIFVVGIPKLQRTNNTDVGRASDEAKDLDKEHHWKRLSEVFLCDIKSRSMTYRRESVSSNLCIVTSPSLYKKWADRSKKIVCWDPSQYNHVVSLETKRSKIAPSYSRLNNVFQTTCWNHLTWWFHR